MLSEKADGKMSKAGYLLGTPSEHCKQYGLTLAEVSRRSGLSVQTLINWHRSRPAVFRLIVIGAHHEAIA